MRTSFMNLKTLPLVAALLIVSCKKNEGSVPSETAKPDSSAVMASDSIKVDHPKSTGQMITADFYGYEEIGDYLYLLIKDNGKTESFVAQAVDKDLNRGDLVEVKWKKGHIEIAGDNDRKEDRKMLVSVKKIKDGALSLFKQRYTKPVKYTFGQDLDLSNEERDDIYNNVQYYLANTRNKLLLLHLKNNEELTYSIEERNEQGKDYIVLGLGIEFENRFSVAQWLYIDQRNGDLYEYDLPNDKLVPFN
ncbi:hypothetical protein ATB97_02895 [Elizabethkingia bruuniana]|nr:hypothetical protein [Elizabethkingia bruuniana]KGO11660.1 hypothetical protein KS04_02925 [Elizabethkingia miricola]AQX84726.1 hypothetical protein AYC65_06775 [Elizabethkingia bruuniana]KUY29091.1 hypothetical protein ATB97_02895 [Elizabethkingia bruuniana]OPB70718.1 hypothetical protein BAY12_19005 [Elizabethkingia bruuniana]QDZ62743.1 hypothetical protein EVD20_08445 [Elizabethkingia bruuniana]